MTCKKRSRSCFRRGLGSIPIDSSPPKGDSLQVVHLHPSISAHPQLCFGGSPFVPFLGVPPGITDVFRASIFLFNYGYSIGVSAYLVNLYSSAF